MPVRARAQCIIPYFTNQPEDVISNTYHFQDTVGSSLEDLADAVQPSLQVIYDGLYASNTASHLAAANTWTTRWYNLDDPPPRVPYVLPLRATGNTGAATAMPLEAAMVVSFQGALVSGQPQARRRGRVYLGGVMPGWVAAGSPSTFPQFTVARANLVAALFVDNLITPGGTDRRWEVYSPTDDAMTLITNGWIDTEIDTQRRRGVAASTRTLFP